MNSRRMKTRAVAQTLLGAFTALALCACAHDAVEPEATAPVVAETEEPVASPPAANRVTVDEDGTVNLPAMSVPVTDLLSPEGQAFLIEHLNLFRTPEKLAFDENLGAASFLQDFIDRQEELFPVEMEDTYIGGVHVYDYTPAGGVPEENAGFVLINLHGGGFMGCWPGCAIVESMPVVSLGGYRVIAVDYRQGPDYKFPAASEDVEKVYTELLKTYPPENIGIFGCSAGGMLTGMSIAWFQDKGLPLPGAIGVYCAGLAAPVNGFGGDASYVATLLGEGRYFGPPPSRDADRLRRSDMAYLDDVDPDDPLVSPASSDAVLAKFPPTQIITGTRSFELSSAVYTHSRLVALGVEAELHVWEGMFHGFYSNPDVPESREAYNVMVAFFKKHLGK